MKDRFSRTINYMRISVTDRCNLRCRYCIPNGINIVPMSDILTYEEIIEITRAAVECGISKLKITGGEPLLRRGVIELISKLKQIKGIEQVTMTTNGTLLAPVISELKKAGLDAINISLDTLNAERFYRITGFNLFNNVISGINAALEADIPTKINVVLQVPEEWQQLLEIAKHNNIDVRFIELMPIGEGKNFRGINNLELLKMIREKYSDYEVDYSVHGNGPAFYIRIKGFKGSIGFISALHQKFCSSCNRIRLTSQGKLKPCLCFADYIDLRAILRQNSNDKFTALKKAIQTAINMKPKEHNFEDIEAVSEKNIMSKIGG